MRGLILDVSEGGLCLLTPVSIEHQESLAIHIEDPRIGPMNIEGLAWHVKKVRGSKPGKMAWSIGVVVLKADDAYYKLLPQSHDTDSAPKDQKEAEDEAIADELLVFKVRVKERASPRTRLLSLTAADENEASKFASADLDEKWSIVEIWQA